MSYSRWGDSRWYTYWGSSEVTKKEDEIFRICGEDEFTYEQLSKGMGGCLMSIALKTNCSFEEIEELKGYMKRFLEDIDIYYLEKLMEENEIR